MDVTVVIGRLVLDGIAVTARDRPLLQAAVEAELARLIDENGLGPGLLAGGAKPAIPGDSLSLRDHQDPITLGRQIAQAVFGGMNR